MKTGNILILASNIPCWLGLGLFKIYRIDVFYPLLAVGILLLVAGIYQMYRESKR